MNWLGSHGDAAARRSGVLTVLDVGSSKVCCVVAQLKPCDDGNLLRGRSHRARVIGIGHQKSQGVKSGVVVDLDRAEHAIRLAVDAAERMAGLTVDSLIVNMTAGRLRSDTFAATINLGGHEVDEADIGRVLAAGAKQALKAEREVIHSLPVAFSLDAERGVRDPRGMVGETLGVDMHVVTGDAAPLRNIELAINRSHLSVERMVATPYASGLASLVDDELEMGAACIDMGGGTTTISIFAEGKFVHGDSVPVGGNHVTLDLAKGLSTSLEAAERLKVMHGSALPGIADDRDVISIQPIGEDGEAPLQIPRAVMTRIIRARVDETLEILRERINKSGFGNAVGKRVVLTGGASQLAGLPEAARRVLGRNVRVGRPLGVAGLPEAAKGPAFSTAVGLLIYPQQMASFESQAAFGGFRFRMTGTGGRLQRVSQWLRDSF
ncbi:MULTISPECIES: cell division protein FtsA [Phyllobacteriaceae]|uniref:Cell division protein FtsA n=1 Tax=Ollibium composti TaxID=2675109 RepID=A0ABY2QBB2_9HYPH|nr:MULTISPECIES: cell division protein FtsA [Mesorhizobium]QDC00051.1 cell division protein FtsA [Mesorhizobium sp. 8]THF59578.1 cell division protein FtsA [Mesorhizobium composti]